MKKILKFLKKHELCVLVIGVVAAATFVGSIMILRAAGYGLSVQEIESQLKEREDIRVIRRDRCEDMRVCLAGSWKSWVNNIDSENAECAFYLDPIGWSARTYRIPMKEIDNALKLCEIAKDQRDKELFEIHKKKGKSK